MIYHMKIFRKTFFNISYYVNIILDIFTNAQV